MSNYVFRLSGSLLALLGASQAAWADCTTFKAVSPYNATINGNNYSVDLASKDRLFDFGGAQPFRNVSTGVTDIATINFWDTATSQGKVLSSYWIPVNGIDGRVFKTQGYTAIGVIAGDGISQDTLRTQVNSYPIPDRKHYTWVLKFRLAGASFDAPWAMAPAGESPATIWQLKAPGIPPALVMAVDTDRNISGKLQLNFDTKLDITQPSLRVATFGNLNPNEDIDVVIDAFLDNRDAAAGGTPFLNITVNNDTRYANSGKAVLQNAATQPYNWSIGAYLYNNHSPLTYDRFTYWKDAKQLVCD